MFTPNAVIDTVQNAKKQFVETFVSDKEIRKSLIELIEAQTAFTKTAAQNALDISKMMIESYGKFDVNKFFVKQ